MGSLNECHETRLTLSLYIRVTVDARRMPRWALKDARTPRCAMNVCHHNNASLCPEATGCDAP
jgi:hypothetical protein